MQVLATVQGKAHWIYDTEWEILANISKNPGSRIAAVLPSDSIVNERALQELVERGWVYYRDTETRPLAGPKVYLTREGETAVRTATDWINALGTPKNKKKKR
jgi:DNA-binding MarR family transcriptional regulator